MKHSLKHFVAYCRIAPGRRFGCGPGARHSSGRHRVNARRSDQLLLSGSQRANADAQLGGRALRQRPPRDLRSRRHIRLLR